MVDETGPGELGDEDDARPPAAGGGTGSGTGGAPDPDGVRRRGEGDGPEDPDDPAPVDDVPAEGPEPVRRGRAAVQGGHLYGDRTARRRAPRMAAWLGSVEVIVCYDVATDSRAGRRRLRRVANVCVAFGQRVQQSVFECRVTEAQLEELEFRLLKEMDESADRLRIYRLAGDRERMVRVFGVEPPNDFREPLIV